MPKIGPKELAMRNMREGKPASASTNRLLQSQLEASVAAVDAEATKPARPVKQESTTMKKPKKSKATTNKARTPVKAKTTKAAKTEGIRPGSKLAIIHGLLTRPEGCTTKEVLKACDWPAVSMPQQAKAAGLTLRKEKVDGVNRYFGTAKAA